jgi:hypothetical protein
MKHYNYYSVKDGDDVFWNVHETLTNTVIDSFIYKEDAREYSQFLEKGGAFYGFTPSFMIRRVLPPIPIDEAFSMEFQ